MRLVQEVDRLLGRSRPWPALAWSLNLVNVACRRSASAEGVIVLGVVAALRESPQPRARATQRIACSRMIQTGKPNRAVPRACPLQVRLPAAASGTSRLRVRPATSGRCGRAGGVARGPDRMGRRRFPVGGRWRMRWPQCLRGRAPPGRGRIFGDGWAAWPHRIGRAAGFRRFEHLIEKLDRDVAIGLDVIRLVAHEQTGARRTNCIPGCEGEVAVSPSASLDGSLKTTKRLT